MSNALPPSRYQRYLNKLYHYSKRLLIVAVLIGGSTLTPIFAVVVGGGLSLIGDWYGHDKEKKPPDAYVILGGGLTENSHQNTPIITLNTYTYNRTKTLWQAWQIQPLPIIASGVEAPWVQDAITYLAKGSPLIAPKIFGENASMNTCENARFSAKLIAHLNQQGNLPNVRHVYLVSDWYHMARARRQFAIAGLATTPLDAPLPTALSWRNPKANLNHSRRAFYESLALIRDIFRPQKNCRTAQAVSLDVINTPRKAVKTF